MTSLSNNPRVFGFVSMNAAVSSETAALSASMSTQPSLDGRSSTSYPTIAALAGLVPWAVSGRITSVLVSPLDS